MDLYSFRFWCHWHWCNTIEIEIPEDFPVDEFEKELENYNDIDLYIYSGRSVVLETKDASEQKRILEDLEKDIDFDMNIQAFVRLRNCRCTVRPAFADFENVYDNSLSDTKIIINHLPYGLTEEELNSSFAKYSYTVTWPPQRVLRYQIRNTDTIFIVSTPETCQRILAERSTIVLRNRTYLLTLGLTGPTPLPHNWAPAVYSSFAENTRRWDSPPPPSVPVPEGVEEWEPKWQKFVAEMEVEEEELGKGADWWKVMEKGSEKESDVEEKKEEEDRGRELTVGQENETSPRKEGDGGLVIGQENKTPPRKEGNEGLMIGQENKTPPRKKCEEGLTAGQNKTPPRKEGEEGFTTGQENRTPPRKGVLFSCPITNPFSPSSQEEGDKRLMMMQENKTPPQKEGKEGLVIVQENKTPPQKEGKEVLVIVQENKTPLQKEGDEGFVIGQEDGKEEVRKRRKEEGKELDSEKEGEEKEVMGECEDYIPFTMDAKEPMLQSVGDYLDFLDEVNHASYSASANLVSPDEVLSPLPEGCSALSQTCVGFQKDLPPAVAPFSVPSPKVCLLIEELFDDCWADTLKDFCVRFEEAMRRKPTLGECSYFVSISREGYHAMFSFHPSSSHPERYHELNAGDYLNPMCDGPKGWSFCTKNDETDVRLCPKDFMGVYYFDKQSGRGPLIKANC